MTKLLAIAVLLGMGCGTVFATEMPSALTDTAKTDAASSIADTMRDLTIDTVYDKKVRMFTTKGRLNSRVDAELLAVIVEAVEDYDAWALTDINKGYKERGLLVMIRRLSFAPDKSELTTIFDLNLPWPFNFKDMTMPLYEQKKEYNSNEQLKFLRYGLRKPTLTLNQFDVEFLLGSESDGGVIDFKFKVRIASLLDTFVSRERYVKNVQGRIAQLMVNLRNHAQQVELEE